VQGLVFVNVEDKNCVAQIDAAKHAVAAKIPLAPAQAPTGLPIDLKHGIRFIGCDKRLAVVDVPSAQVLTTLPIGDGCDATTFDAETNLVFASCGDGKMSVVRVVDGKAFRASRQDLDGRQRSDVHARCDHPQALGVGWLAQQGRRALARVRAPAEACAVSCNGLKASLGNEKASRRARGLPVFELPPELATGASARRALLS